MPVARLGSMKIAANNVKDPNKVVKNISILVKEHVIDLNAITKEMNSLETFLQNVTATKSIDQSTIDKIEKMIDDITSKFGYTRSLPQMIENIRNQIK